MIINIKNDISEINEVCNKIDQFCAENNIPNKKRQDIDLIVDELASNVIFYAYPDGEEHSFTLSLDLVDGVVTIKIIDAGSEFNPLNKDDPDIELSAEEREIGGLGIFLVKQLSEKVSYQRLNNKNHLTIVVSIKLTEDSSEENGEITDNQEG